MRTTTLVTILLIIGAILSACESNSNKISTNSSEMTSEKEGKVSKKEYASLVGTWECLDELEKGSKVYISRNDKGVNIEYEGTDTDITEFVSKAVNKEYTFYDFEDKEKELGFSISLLKNKNIILNFGTRNPKMTGETKPMEYRLVTE